MPSDVVSVGEGAGLGEGVGVAVVDGCAVLDGVTDAGVEEDGVEDGAALAAGVADRPTTGVEVRVGVTVALCTT